MIWCEACFTLTEFLDRDGCLMDMVVTYVARSRDLNATLVGHVRKSQGPEHCYAAVTLTPTTAASNRKNAAQPYHEACVRGHSRMTSRVFCPVFPCASGMNAGIDTTVVVAVSISKIHMAEIAADGPWYCVRV